MIEPTTRPGGALGWVADVFAYSFATSFIFGIVSVLNALALGFFYYFPRTIHIALVDSRIDVAIWICSVFCLSALVMWSSKGSARWPLMSGLALLAVTLSVTLLIPLQNEAENNLAIYGLFTVTVMEFVLIARQSGSTLKQPLRAPISRVLIYLLIYLVIIEVSAAAYNVMRSFDPTTRIGLVNADIELQFSYVSYGLLPFLYVGFLFSWAWVPLVQKLLPRTRLNLHTSEASTADNERLTNQTSYANRLTKLLDPRLFLALILAAFLWYYPYFHNPRWLVGTDALWRYYDPLLRMKGKGIFGGFVQALSERHAVMLSLLYSAQLVFQTTAFYVVRLVPILLVAGLGFSTWWFLVRKRNADLGLIAFVMSAMSVTTTVGLFSSILANWMALVVWVAFFGYVSLKSDKGLRVWDIAVLLVLSSLILFIHPWTWGVFAATVLMAAIVTLIRERRVGFRASALLISIILTGAFMAFLGIVLGESQGWKIVDALDLYTVAVGNPSLPVFWAALNWLVRIWAPFFSPLYLAVSILGVFCLATAKLTFWSRRLILAWLCVSSVASVFVAPIGFNLIQPSEGETQLWRLLFLTPFQLTAPFGIAWLAQLPHRLQPQNRIKPKPVSMIESTFAVWLIALVAIGILSTWMPSSIRLILVVVFVPGFTGVALRRSNQGESVFLVALTQAVLLLVVFNYATRALSQLLIDPHNYIP